MLRFVSVETSLQLPARDVQWTLKPMIVLGLPYSLGMNSFRRNIGMCKGFNTSVEKSNNMVSRAKL